MVPRARRKAAVARTRHLDILSSLRTPDDDDEEPSVTTRSGGADPTAGFPENMGLTKKPQFTAAEKRIRLEGLMRRCMEPLEELLGDKRHFLSEEFPSSIDTLVAGYLSLIVYADVPDHWAPKILDARFPKLSKWTRNQKHLFDDVLVLNPIEKS
jgi:hypothetical protein